MPCTKCNSDFNVFNWKLKCAECDERYCTRCLKKHDGCSCLYCEKCLVLMKRPPDREKLMELRSKDLQDYLNKNHISTRGLVEKQELVELFYRNPIPIPQRRGAQRFTANFGGSVPNLARPQAYINNLRSNVESVLTNTRASGLFSATTSPTRESQPVRPPRHSPPPRPDPPQFTQPTTSAPDFQKESEPSPKQSRFPQLSDFESSDELKELSTKQLKELLTLNRVDYKGCVEKTELLERAERLWNDSNKYKNEELPESVEDLCKLCMDAPLDCVLLECGHVATCINCGKQLAECPICRQYVSRVVRIFKA